MPVRLSSGLFQALSLCLYRTTPDAVLLPFLYQTRTLVSSPHGEPVKPGLRRLDLRQTRARPSSPDSTAPDLNHGIVGRENSEAQQGGSTVTGRERAIFTRIFNDIVASPGTGVQGEESTAAGPLDLPDSLDALFGVAARAAPPRRAEVSYAPKSNWNGVESQGRGQVLGQTTMKKPATIASGALDSTAGEREQREQLERVQKLLLDASTDLGLWSVLERQVFPMVSNLRGGKDRKPGRRIKEKGPTEQNRSQLAVVGTNYPHLIHVAFRQLRFAFRAPATCLALFAKIKTLGPISLVLAANTTMYNELIDLTYAAYSDLHGVLALLEEMDKGGVAFDGTTQTILRDILGHARAMQDSTTPVGQPTTASLLTNLKGFTSPYAKLVRWAVEIGRQLLAAQAAEAASRVEDEDQHDPEAEDEDKLDDFGHGQTMPPPSVHRW